MKVKTLLKVLKEYSEKYEDFPEWEIYTEQCGLVAPDNFKTIQEEKELLEKESKEYNIPMNNEWIEELIKSKEKMEELKSMGWKFKIDSEGWVYKNCAVTNINNEEESFHTIFVKDKIFTINNNY